MSPSPVGISDALHLFSYGLYAVGVRDGEDRNAFTANWVAQVSSDPPRVAVAVENDGRSADMIRRSGVFSVCVYGADQRKMAARLARPAARAPDKLTEYEHVDGAVTGAPVLVDSLACVECRVEEARELGDHVLFIGHVVGGEVRAEGEPLTLRSARFRYG
jgi:flavin reductase (DIM6/NTAB) family NADH-FMN oxidoreductase RutF